MRVELWLKETSQPIIFENTKNAYTKGALYCVYVGDTANKFPIDHIFRVVESY